MGKYYWLFIWLISSLIISVHTYIYNRILFGIVLKLMVPILAIFCFIASRLFKEIVNLKNKKL